MKIDRIETFVTEVPLPVASAYATRRLRSREFVFARVTDSDGARGTGYTYATAGGGKLVRDCVSDIFAPLLAGSAVASVDELWDAMYREALLLGRRGLVLRAISAVDMALWDLLGIAGGIPAFALLGGSRKQVPAYVTGGFYRGGDEVTALKEEFEGYVARGLTSFKMKVGGADARTDVSRVAAVRDVVGPDALLALDANNAWRSPSEALQGMAHFKRFDPWWFEEPLPPDDFFSYADVRSKADVPIATGEVHATRWEFGALMRLEAADIFQPDALVVGGVSETLKVAHTAASLGLPIALHWHPDVHVHIASAIGNCMAMEYFDPQQGLSAIDVLMEDCVRPENGSIEAPDRPGFGIAWDEKQLERYRVA